MSVQGDATRAVNDRTRQRLAVRSSLKAGGLTSFSGTVWYLAILVTTTFFASTSFEAAGLRSLLVPLALLLGGVSMLFSVPSQISAARGSSLPGGATIRSLIFWTFVLASTLAVIALGAVLALGTVARPLTDGLPDEAAARSFLSLMPLAYVFVVASDFIEGFLRGCGRFLQASSLVVTRAVVICCSYAVWVGPLDGDPLALPWFYMAGGGVSLIAGTLVVMILVRPTRVDTSPSGRDRMGRLVGRVGLPVLASYVLLSSVVGIQITFVSIGLGRDAEIAFSGMQTVQTLCVVAAMGVAVGVSSEVLRRAAGGGLSTRTVNAVIARVSTIVFVIEAVVLIVFLAVAGPVLDLLLVGVSVSQDLRIGAVLLVVTALFIANDVLVLTVLEEIGVALLSLGLNILYFAALVAVTWTTTQRGTFTSLAAGLLILSITGAGALRGVLLLRSRLRPNKSTSQGESA